MYCADMLLNVKKKQRQMYYSDSQQLQDGDIGYKLYPENESLATY